MTKPALRRTLSLPLLTLYGLGTILGAGIYVLVGKVAGVSGSYAPAAFFMAALLAALTGYSYAQLSALFPKSAGEAVYIQQGLQKRWLAQLAGWLVMITGIVSAATLTRGFIGYLGVFLSLPDLLTVTTIIAAITFLACWGIRESAITAAIITIIEIIGLLIVIVAFQGSLFSNAGNWANLIPPFDLDIWLTISLGAFIAFYAFVGFEDMVNVAEEVIEPEKTLPKAIMLAVLFSSLLYVIIAIIAIFNLPVDELSQGDAPLARLLALKNQSLANLIALIGLVAVINGALVQVIMSSRMLYGLAKQSMAPKIFSQIHHSFHTPVFATLTIALFIWLFAMMLPLVTLAKLTSFITLTVFFLINASLFRIRLSNTASNFWINRSTVIPMLGGISCLLLLLIQLSQFIVK